MADEDRLAAHEYDRRESRQDGAELIAAFGRLPAPSVGGGLDGGEPLVLGVRPSDIRVARDSDASVAAAVQQIEPLGDVTIVSLLARDNSCASFCPSPRPSAFKPGDELPIAIDASKFTFSVVTTGRRSTGNRDKEQSLKRGRKQACNGTKRLATVAAMAALAFATGAAIAPAQAEDVTLKMAVPDWPPTHIMKDLFDKNYKPKSGNTVKLDVDFIPWPDYYTRLNASLTSGEKKYNMAVSDSQWLGAFIEGGYYLKINKYVDADPGLQAVFKDLHPAVKDRTRPIRTSRTNFTDFRRCRTSS